MDKWKGRVGYQTNQLNSTDLRLPNATQWVLHNWQGRQGCESKRKDPIDVNPTSGFKIQNSQGFFPANLESKS
jgi:hypothetical protein